MLPRERDLRFYLQIKTSEAIGFVEFLTFVRFFEFFVFIASIVLVESFYFV